MDRAFAFYTEVLGGTEIRISQNQDGGFDVTFVAPDKDIQDFLDTRQGEIRTALGDKLKKDVNVNVTYLKNAQVKLGKFKIPFGLDEMTGVTQNDYIYRSLGANYLAPARDIGGMVHGRFFKRGVNYWAGFFRHDGDNARSKKILGGDRTFAARLTARPFRRLARPAIGAIELGTAYADSVLSDDSFRLTRLGASRGRISAAGISVAAPRLESLLWLLSGVANGCIFRTDATSP